MRRFLPLFILLIALGGFAALRATRPAPSPVEARERVWQIEALTAQTSSVQPTLVLYGRVEAPDQVRAAAPVGGRILELNARDGDRVTAGTVLARLDPRDLQPRLAQAQADVEREHIRQRFDVDAVRQEKTLLALAQAKVARFEKLKDARLSAESAFDQAREEAARVQLMLSQREQAIAEHPARLAQLQARLAEARRDAQRGEITAAFDARIGKVEVAAGDQVQAGQTLLTLYASDALFLRARVPAIYAEELRSALHRGEVLRAEADFGSQRVLAQLERIAGEADARGVEVLLRLVDSNPVPAGAFLNAVLQRPQVDDVIALPPAALHGGDRVYMVQDERLVGVRVSRVGERREGEEVRLLVRAPQLDTGSTVMVTHLPHAIDGLAVEVIQPESRTAPAARSAGAA